MRRTDRVELSTAILVSQNSSLSSRFPASVLFAAAKLARSVASKESEGAEYRSVTQVSIGPQDLGCQAEAEYLAESDAELPSVLLNA
jgi:hypothetical protein